jgi:hypothetical protein
MRLGQAVEGHSRNHEEPCILGAPFEDTPEPAERHPGTGSGANGFAAAAARDGTGDEVFHIEVTR